jgi:hypothetical protein
VDALIINDPVLRQRLRFSRTTDPDGAGRWALRVEAWVDPAAA